MSPSFTFTAAMIDPRARWRALVSAPRSRPPMVDTSTTECCERMPFGQII
jgi:hypothetical protein